MNPIELYVSVVAGSTDNYVLRPMRETALVSFRQVLRGVECLARDHIDDFQKHTRSSCGDCLDAALPMFSLSDLSPGGIGAEWAMSVSVSIHRFYDLNIGPNTPEFNTYYCVVATI